MILAGKLNPNLGKEVKKKKKKKKKKKIIIIISNVKKCLGGSVAWKKHVRISILTGEAGKKYISLVHVEGRDSIRYLENPNDPRVLWKLHPIENRVRRRGTSFTSEASE